MNSDEKQSDLSADTVPDLSESFQEQESSENSDPAPTRRRRKKVKKKKASGCLIAVMVFMLAIMGTALFALYEYNRIANFNEAYNPDDASTVEFSVKRGSTTLVIAEKLESYGLIESADIFVYKSKIAGTDAGYQAGDFLLSPSMTMEEIMEALRHPIVAVRHFTIAEGLNLVQIGRKLEEQEICTAEAFYAALEDSYDYGFLEPAEADEPTGTLSRRANRLEGLLFPDTYEIYAGSSPHEVIDKMLARFDELYTGDIRAKAEALGLSMREVCTIASLIERECRVDEERPLVSSVIFNRLNISMKLQFCSTVQYAQGEVKSRLTTADTQIDSVYNTYIIDGLPPGPISNFGKASLEAAVAPADTDYLYFVVKNDGSKTHNFASNYEDFSNYKDDYLNTLD
ncbi:MAG TPA: endolytic transglycosylase MltG [Bacillota bacterium]|nr:endolytic transglycosylase MltG [Bacillota bacterium]